MRGVVGDVDEEGVARVDVFAGRVLEDGEVDIDGAEDLGAERGGEARDVEVVVLVAELGAVLLCDRELGGEPAGLWM